MGGFVKGIIVIVLTAGFITAWTASYCFAGAWTLKKGKLYNRLSVNSLSADSEFDKDGKKKRFASNGKFSDINLNNYLEYGLSDRMTLINSLYYKQIEKRDNFRTANTYGIGDIDLGVKFKIAEGGFGALSQQTLVKIPAAYDRNNALPLGNGQYDAELKLLYGVSLWRLFPGYGNFEAGYRWRGEAPSDELRYLVEIGADFTQKFYGRAKLDGIMSMKNSDKTTDSKGNPVITNEFDLGKLDITLGYKISDKWGLEVGYTPSIYGSNTAESITYSFAVIYQIP